MENEENLQIATIKRLGDVELKNSALLDEVDGLKVKKVLAVNTITNINSKEPLDSNLKIGGDIEYNFILQLENDEVVSTTIKQDYSLNYENKSIGSGSNLDVVVSSSEATVENIDVSSTTIFTIYENCINSSLSMAKSPENVFVKEEEFSYHSLLLCKSYDAVANFELIKDNKFNKILYVVNNASIKSVMPSSGYFVVAYEICSTVIYKTEDGDLKCTTINNSFSNEFEANGIDKEDIVQARIITCESVVNESEDRFSVEVPIKLDACIYQKKTLPCIMDAYCLENEIKLTSTTCEKDEFLPVSCAVENILTNYSLDESLNQIEKVLAVVPKNIRVVSQIVKDGEVLIDGIASVCVIYYYENEDGERIIDCSNIDIPYSLTFGAGNVTSDDKVGINISFGDINVKSRHGRELEFLIELKINYNVVKSQISYLTNDITLGESKEDKDYAMEIYIAKENETLWDIAKKLNVKISDIMGQNKDLTLPIKSGDKIVAFRRATN